MFLIIHILGLPNITVSHVTDFMNRSIKLFGAVFVSDDSPGIQEVFWSKNGEKIDIQGSGGRLSGVTIDDRSRQTFDVIYGRREILISRKNKRLRDFIKRTRNKE